MRIEMAHANCPPEWYQIYRSLKPAITKGEALDNCRLPIDAQDEFNNIS